MRKIFIYLNVLLSRNLIKKEFVKPINILLVSNTALGDTILSTPAIKSVRLKFPKATITLMVSKRLYSFFKEYECVDQVIVYKSSLIGMVAQVMYLKIKKFDTIFFFHSNGPQDLLLAILSGANNILKAINYPGKVSNEFHKIMINEVDYQRTKHIIEHRLDLVRCFDPIELDKTFSIPSKYPVNYKKQELKTIAVQLSAADIYKTWPLSNFLELMHKVVESLDGKCKIILLGINTERSLATEFEKKFKFPHLIENLCGKTSIFELKEVLQNSNLLITNDTGTLHLSVAVETPTISLFSSTDPKVFGPYQDLDKHKVVFVDGSCLIDSSKKQRSQDAMRLISVDDVFDAFVELKRDLFICVE